MLPYISIGSLNISTYYTAMFFGFVVMVILMLLPRRRAIYSLKPLKSFLFALAVLFCGILGCKILFIIENMRQVREDGLSIGGFSFFGAVFIVPLLMLLFGKAFRMDWRDTLDNAAINVLGMLATIRIGCFLNGCCGGVLCTIGSASFHWPTQIMEAIFDFGILVWLLILEQRPGNIRGLLYPRFMIAYGTVRFVIEWFRTTEIKIGIFHISHFWAMLSIIIGVSLYFEIKTNSKKKRSKQHV